jgi:hypothetical protein
MQDRVKCYGCGKLSGFDDFVAGALRDGIHSREFMIHVIGTGAENSSPPHGLQCMNCGSHYKLTASKTGGFLCLHPKTWSKKATAVFECLHPKTWNGSVEKEIAEFECLHPKTWAQENATFDCLHGKTWARVEVDSVERTD